MRWTRHHDIRRLFLFWCRDFQTNIDTDDRDVTRSYWPSVRAHKDRQTGGTSLFASVNFLYASGRFSSN